MAQESLGPTDQKLPPPYRGPVVMEIAAALNFLPVPTRRIRHYSPKKRGLFETEVTFAHQLALLKDKSFQEKIALAIPLEERVLNSALPLIPGPAGSQTIDFIAARPLLTHLTSQNQQLFYAIQIHRKNFEEVAEENDKKRTADELRESYTHSLLQLALHLNLIPLELLRPSQPEDDQNPED